MSTPFPPCARLALTSSRITGWHGRVTLQGAEAGNYSDEASGETLRLLSRQKPKTTPEKEAYKMNVRPLHDRVLVRRIEKAEQVRGGIIIPDSAR